MLTKSLLRVSRAGGGYHPQFAGEDDEALAARVLGVYQGHVGEPQGTLADALETIEREADDFKLVRGFAKLLERDATFETRSPVEPERAREAVFAAAEASGVVTEDERTAALRRAADGLGVTAGEAADALYADLEERQVLSEFDPRWTPAELVARYNLSLAQTALFDATEVRARSSDPRALVSAVKRLGLMYEIYRTNEGGEGEGGTSEARAGYGRSEDGGNEEREVVVTGPDALFHDTRRYGVRFARLLRTIVKAEKWRVDARIDDRGTERDLRLTAEDPLSVPGAEPVAEVEYDSAVEADFAARFSALDSDWDLAREPAPLATGTRVMIPDFAFDYRYADFRVYFEIVGFWTPEYVEKKVDQLEHVEEVDLIVAADESLGVGEAIETRDHRVIGYSGRVRVKDVRDVLREYERDLEAEHAAAIPDELVPDPDVVTLETLAADYGVSEAAVEGKTFPEHERVGRTLVRPPVLDELRARIEPGTSFEETEAAIAELGITEASAVLAALGYRVEWEGLGGGTVRET